MSLALDERVAPGRERRRHSRLSLPIATQLSLNGTSCDGRTADIGVGGALILSLSALPAREGQPIQLGFVSEIGVLEIKGRILRMRDDVGENAAALSLAVEFQGVNPNEAMILGSLLEGLRERPDTVRLTVQLIPQDTGDLLVDMGSVERPDDRTTFHAVSADSQEADEPSDADKRLNARVHISIPATLEPEQPNGFSASLPARLVDLSMTGACVSVPGKVPDLLGHRICLRTALSSLSTSQSSAAADTEIILKAAVMWLAQDIETRIGMRFLPLEAEAAGLVADIVGARLASARSVSEPENAAVHSEPFEYRNQAGRRIALYYDRPRTSPPLGTPCMVLAPGYGETKKEYVSLGYYLASNGFHVLRFDYTDHIGESEGEIQATTLSGMKADLQSILICAESRWPDSPLGVVATSLSGRVALKLLAEDRRIKLLVLLTSVVDVQATLLAVHQEDLVGTHLQGVRRGLTNVLGFNVNLDVWLEDAVQGGYADLRSTIRDASLVQAPVVLFGAEQDVWVRAESVTEVRTALGANAPHSYQIPEALHRLHENPRKARAVFHQLVERCLNHFQMAAPDRPIIEPSKREIGLQARLERERARAQNQMAKNENLDFWRDYLDHFHYIVNFSDYWHLLDHIYRLLGTVQDGERVLDAGCGNGNFAMFLLINQAYRSRHASLIEAVPLRYLGTDFVATALSHARHNFFAVAAEQVGSAAVVVPDRSPIITSLCRADLNMPLPFQDGRFDRIISNLVIGYLDDPLFTLRELVRVLVPGGKLVVTNLKPQADLSQIYRNFVQLTNSSEEIEEARQLLNNSGKIKQGESNGIFRFFGKKEFAAMLLSAGACAPRVYSTFANQAFIAVTQKPDTQTAQHDVAHRTPGGLQGHA